jgi:hypothetical protein
MRSRHRREVSEDLPTIDGKRVQVGSFYAVGHGHHQVQHKEKAPSDALAKHMFLNGGSFFLRSGHVEENSANITTRPVLTRFSRPTVARSGDQSLAPPR